MRSGRSLALLFCCLLLTACGTPRPRFEPESIHRLNRSPAPHVGRAVALHGVATDPETGLEGALGNYLLCDETGGTVLVLSRRLPRAGTACRVSGFVGQTPQNALQPLVLEVHRSRPLRDLLVTLGLLALVLCSVPPALVRLKRLQRLPAPPAGFAAPSEDALPVRPGVAYALDLVVVAGPDTGRRHSFRSDRILVGRPGLRNNDLTLDDQTVSRKQALILRDDKIGGYKIRNEGRTNPLKVNGRPCDAVALRDGDLLTVGLTTLQVGYRQLPRSKGDGGRSLKPLALLVCLLTAISGSAVDAGPGESIRLERLDLQSLPLVTCRFRVPGDGGVSRLGLAADDFRLLVDGRPLENPELLFEADPGQPPLRLALVVQTSREDQGRGLFLLKSAVSEFLERMPGGVPAALFSHGAEAILEQGMTTDRRRLLQRLESVSLDLVPGRGAYYDALDRAAGLLRREEPGLSAVVYFCRPGTFTREDMHLDAPKGLRGHPGVPVYPVLHPERDGSRTKAYLRQLALKLTERFTGHYTLRYTSPGGEDNRVHSLRIDRISSDGGSGETCRYRAVTGMGLETGAALADADRRRLLDRLAGIILGLLAGALAFRWIVGGRSAARGAEIRRLTALVRIHFLVAGGLTGFLLSVLAGSVR